MKNAFLGAFCMSFGYTVFLGFTSDPLPTSISCLLAIALWAIFTNIEDMDFPIRDARLNIGISIGLCILLGFYLWLKI